MAEDQNSKDEEKCEVNPDGETLGYISLGQARVWAIEHAPDQLGVTGQSAVGQCTIDKAGPITLRQSLSGPRPRRGPLHFPENRGLH